MSDINNKYTVDTNGVGPGRLLVNRENLKTLIDCYPLIQGEGENSVILRGGNNSASGKRAVAIGSENYASADNSIVIGSDSSVSDSDNNSIVIGHGIESLGANTIMIGQNIKAADVEIDYNLNERIIFGLDSDKRLSIASDTIKIYGNRPFHIENRGGIYNGKFSLLFNDKSLLPNIDNEVTFGSDNFKFKQAYINTLNSNATPVETVYLKTLDFENLGGIRIEDQTPLLKLWHINNSSGTFSHNVLYPSEDLKWDLGTSEKRFKDIFTKTLTSTTIGTTTLTSITIDTTSLTIPNTTINNSGITSKKIIAQESASLTNPDLEGVIRQHSSLPSSSGEWYYGVAYGALVVNLTGGVEANNVVVPIAFYNGQILKAASVMVSESILVSFYFKGGDYNSKNTWVAKGIGVDGAISELQEIKISNPRVYWGGVIKES